MNYKKYTIISGLLLTCATTYTHANFNFEQCSGSGSFEQEIISYNGDNNNDILVGTIPEGIEGLHITLESEVDVDVRLYGENNDKVVRWPDGILSRANQETQSYQDVDITYSGYNGVDGARGHEFITVHGTTPTAFTMKAFGYRPGFATVNYEWTGKAGCSDTGTGSFTQEIPSKDIALVGEIPGGIANLQVNLTSDKDIDIQLYGEDGVAIIKWPDGLLNGATKKSIEYNNMQITWSGYNGTNGQKGHEYIKITGDTTEKLTMKVFGYQAGMADVTYSWGPEAVTPDYTSKIILFNNELSENTASNTVPVIITVSELSGGTNSAPVIVAIPKHPYLKLSYDNTNDFTFNTVVENKNWELDTSHNGEYRFKYIGHGGVFPASSFSKLSFNISANNIPNGTSGTIDFTSYIKPGNGDENFNNDDDPAVINYNF